MVERETERRVAVNTRRAGQPACGTSCRFEPARRLASGSCRPLPQAPGHTPGSPDKTDWRPGHPAIRRTRPGERIRASPRRSVRPAARARGARPVSRNTDDGAGIGPVPSLEYSLHEESPGGTGGGHDLTDRKSTRLNSSHVEISYAVFCLKKKTISSAPIWLTR